MKIQQIENKGLEYKFLLSLDTFQIQKDTQTRLSHIANQYKKPGFRPGKVPLSMIQREFGTDVISEIRDIHLKHGLATLLQENNLTPLRHPSIKEVSLFNYEITIEQSPTFEMRDLSELKIERLEADITDQEIDQFTEKLRRLMGTFESVDRAVEANDFVGVEYKVTYNGNVVDEIEGIEDRIDLLSPGVDHIDAAEKFVGAKIGDEIVVQKSGKRVKEELQDKMVDVTYVVKSVHVCTPHEMNEKLLKRFKSDSLEVFKERLRNSLSSTTSRMAYMHMKRQLLDNLSELYDFEVPGNMVQEETRTITKKITEERDRNPEFTEEITDEEVLVLAKRRVQLGILISRMANEYKITVPEDKIVYSMYVYACTISNNPYKLMDTWVKQPDLVAFFRAELLELAVIDYLIENATVDVKKVTVRELYQEASDFLLDSYELDGLIDEDEDEEDDETIEASLIDQSSNEVPSEVVEAAAEEEEEAVPTLEEVKEKKARKPRKKAEPKAE
ncbi:MAG: Trigger factor [Holosporales bacterium]